jgi:hypothetical protein
MDDVVDIPAVIPFEREKGIDLRQALRIAEPLNLKTAVEIDWLG